MQSIQVLCERALGVCCGNLHYNFCTNFRGAFFQNAFKTRSYSFFYVRKVFAFLKMKSSWSFKALWCTKFHLSIITFLLKYLFVLLFGIHLAMYLMNMQIYSRKGDKANRISANISPSNLLLVIKNSLYFLKNC